MSINIPDEPAYHLICDGCGAEGPGADGEDTATEKAEDDAGWAGSHGNACHDLCPACYAKADEKETCTCPKCRKARGDREWSTVALRQDSPATGNVVLTPDGPQTSLPGPPVTATLEDRAWLPVLVRSPAGMPSGADPLTAATAAELAKSWESAVELLRGYGYDPDELVRKAGENLAKYRRAEDAAGAEPLDLDVIERDSLGLCEQCPAVVAECRRLRADLAKAAVRAVVRAECLSLEPWNEFFRDLRDGRLVWDGNEWKPKG